MQPSVSATPSKPTTSPRWRRSSTTAPTARASWGVGHAVPITLLGLALVALGIRLPAAASFAWGGAVTAGRGVEALAGLASIAVGMLLVVEQIGGVA